MASNTEALDLAETTVVYRYSDGRLRELRELVKKLCSDDVSFACLASHESRLRSETKPVKSFEEGLPCTITIFILYVRVYRCTNLTYLGEYPARIQTVMVEV